MWYNCEQKCLLEDMFFFSGWCYIDFSLKSMRPQGQIKISPSKGFLTDGRSSSSTDRWLHWQGGSGGTHHRSHSHSFWSGWKDPLQTLQQMWLDRRFADDLQQEGRVTWNQQVNETRDRCTVSCWVWEIWALKKAMGGDPEKVFTTTIYHYIRNRVEQRRKTPQSWSIMNDVSIQYPFNHSSHTDDFRDDPCIYTSFHFFWSPNSKSQTKAHRCRHHWVLSRGTSRSCSGIATTLQRDLRSTSSS